MLVIKVGGGTGINIDNVLDDLQNHPDSILVHGGNAETNILSERLDKPPKVITSPSGYTSRLTDPETIDIMTMVYAGKLNKCIVARLQQRGINAVGLSGVDGRLLEGKRKSSVRSVEDGKVKVIRNDYTGRVERVNTSLLEILISNGYLPVITIPAISYEHEAINVDGDRAASVIAASMKAERLIILSNVAGLLSDVNDENSVIPTIQKDALDEHIEQYAKDRMKKKLLGAKEALNAGVSQVILASANTPSPITSALAKNGTVIE
ncbi:MAG: [LysW]-aminoadipate kinase [Thermoplasmata archaeon]|nr:MAG: [LysW]-aminoadipate kinase [Thermoplasmata archaeon]